MSIKPVQRDRNLFTDDFTSGKLAARLSDEILQTIFQSISHPHWQFGGVCQQWNKAFHLDICRFMQSAADSLKNSVAKMVEEGYLDAAFKKIQALNHLRSQIDVQNLMKLLLESQKRTDLIEIMINEQVSKTANVMLPERSEDIEAVKNSFATSIAAGHLDAAFKNIQTLILLESHSEAAHNLITLLAESKKRTALISQMLNEEHNRIIAELISMGKLDAAFTKMCELKRSYPSLMTFEWFKKLAQACREKGNYMLAYQVIKTMTNSEIKVKELETIIDEMVANLGAATFEVISNSDDLVDGVIAKRLACAFIAKGLFKEGLMSMRYLAIVPSHDKHFIAVTSAFLSAMPFDKAIMEIYGYDFLQPQTVSKLNKSLLISESRKDLDAFLNKKEWNQAALFIKDKMADRVIKESAIYDWIVAQLDNQVELEQVIQSISPSALDISEQTKAIIITKVASDFIKNGRVDLGQNLMRGSLSVTIAHCVPFSQFVQVLGEHDPSQAKAFIDQLEGADVLKSIIRSVYEKSLPEKVSQNT